MIELCIVKTETDSAAVQLPVTDNVNNTVVVEGRLKRLRKLSCQLQAI